MPVPHLTTALTGPLQELETALLAKQTVIEGWFRQQWGKTPAPLYGSVDLRNAGFKVAPVDTNLFPAGFNNLNEAFAPLCIQALQSILERICPYANRFVLVPENHTRNTFYLESIAAFAELIRRAGFDVDIGSLIEDIEAPQTIDLPSGRSITLNPLIRKDNTLFVKTAADESLRPCAVLLNNDLSGGKPAILEGIEQEILPPLELGWSNRLKSNHFAVYQEVATEFASLLDIDPWLINPLFRNCGEVDFRTGEGQNCLQVNVAQLLLDVKAKYDAYGITKEPFAIVKADAGTYGMGIMTVRSPDDVAQLNKKQRNKMARGKEGLDISQVIIQEGVYTSETWTNDNEDSATTESSIAEPVVYMIDHFVVGGFYRVHTARGEDENLNAPGAEFKPLAFVTPGSAPVNNNEQQSVEEPNRFYAYGVIARLALLAAAREIAQVKQ